MLDADLLLPERPRPLKRAEYDRMVAMGLFEDEHVELLHGVLVEMGPNDPPHSSPIQQLNEILLPALLRRAKVRIQLPLIAADESEPEPDLAVVPLGDYRSEHPSVAHLVIEVAYTSLKKDRGVKAPLYAASGFTEYWIVNVPDQVVEVYRAPRDGAYTQTSRHGSGASLRLEAFSDVSVAVAEIFA